MLYNQVARCLSRALWLWYRVASTHHECQLRAALSPRLNSHSLIDVKSFLACDGAVGKTASIMGLGRRTHSSCSHDLVVPRLGAAA